MRLSIALRALVCVLGWLLLASSAHAADQPLTRRDAFVLIWQSIARAVGSPGSKPFLDVSKNDSAFAILSFAKQRGFFDEHATHTLKKLVTVTVAPAKKGQKPRTKRVPKNVEVEETIEQDRFHPDDPVRAKDALFWVFRSRNLEHALSDGSRKFLAPIERSDLPRLEASYQIMLTDDAILTRDQLVDLLRSIDEALLSERHEVSLYAEESHGKGTAFGETFDMTALTAAHRSFPYNTLVNVTNVENGKSVIVRINDRGPFVAGRDMDLSLAAFTAIADRSKGKINATFQRLGDATVLERCHDKRFQQRIAKDVILSSGVPHFLPLGASLRLHADQFFVVESIRFPDGTIDDTQQWIGPTENFLLKPSILGTYSFLLSDKTGRRRTMEMEVVECNNQQ